jgi:hypothetical protein
VNVLALNAREQEELYVILKPREETLVEELSGLLRRIERELFQRMTIEELEKLASRFPRAH